MRLDYPHHCRIFNFSKRLCHAFHSSTQSLRFWSGSHSSTALSRGTLLSLLSLLLLVLLCCLCRLSSFDLSLCIPRLDLKQVARSLAQLVFVSSGLLCSGILLLLVLLSLFIPKKCQYVVRMVNDNGEDVLFFLAFLKLSLISSCRLLLLLILLAPKIMLGCNLDDKII